MPPLVDSERLSGDCVLAILESMPVGVAVFSSTGCLAYVNQSAAALLDEQALSRQLPIDDALAGKDQFFPALEVHHQGRQLWLEAWIFAVRDQADAIESVVAVFQDIRNRRLSEDALRESELRFRDLAQNVPGGIFRYVHRPDGSSSVLYMSEGCRELWETEAETVVNDAQILWSMVHEDDLAPMRQSVLESLQHLAPWTSQWRIITQSGKLKWLEATGRPSLQANGDVIWNTLIMDVTARKQVDIALAENEARYRLLTENMNDMVCLHEADGHYLYVSPSSKQLVGYEPEELLGADPYRFFHPDDIDRIRDESHHALLNQGLSSMSITFRHMHKAGGYVWLESLTRAIRNEQGVVTHLQSASRDVSERVRVEEQLRHDALYDPLTGLANRTQLLDQLGLMLQRLQRSPERKSAVLFLDCDRFKIINDSLGHLLGDELLQLIGRRIQRLAGDSDLIARVGGDEFAVLLDGMDAWSDASRFAERINPELGSIVARSGRELFLTASIGIVLLDGGYADAMEVLRDADIAMYRSKRAGGARYALFDPAMREQLVAYMQTENDLRRALQREEFCLHYQPIVSLSSGSVVAIEALIRWQHPERGLVAPDQFIPIAEDCQLIYPIGLWVIGKACADYASLCEKLGGQQTLSLSVNLSLQQVLAPKFLRDVLEILKDYESFGDFLTFEITESVLAHDLPGMANLLRELKSHGIRVSIDDFGTGYSSLSYLHRLPVDALKVDRSFVSNCAELREARKIIESIVALSDSLGLDAVAEGIETEAQLHLLQRLGCEKGQGYLFDRPLELGSLEQVLQHERPYAATLESAL
ncbi:MAG: sensor domain-containing protein [Wenzhouxiangella sp.]